MNIGYTLISKPDVRYVCYQSLNGFWAYNFTDISDTSHHLLAIF